MLAQAVEKNFKTLPQEKNSAEKNSAADEMILTEEESIYFKDEINKQIVESKIIDIGKAVRNARYLAMLDRGFAQADRGEGTMMTFEELRSMIDDAKKDLF